MIIRGLSGGFIFVKEKIGRENIVIGLCVGFIDRELDYRLVLNGFFKFLKFEV